MAVSRYVDGLSKIKKKEQKVSNKVISNFIFFICRYVLPQVKERYQRANISINQRFQPFLGRRNRGDKGGDPRDTDET